MMRYTLGIIYCLGLSVVTPLIHAKGNDQFKDHFVGQIKPKIDLLNVLDQEGRTSGIIFCSETLIGKKSLFQQSKDRSNLSNKSTAMFIKTLEQEGFICTHLNKIVLVSDPAAFSLKSNPLNKSMKGFKFKGSHKELLYTIAKQAKILNPNIISTGGALCCINYDINIEQKITVRDLLLYISETYGITWQAMVEKSPCVLEFKQMDRTVEKIKMSNLTLAFASRNSRCPTKEGIKN